MNISFIILTWNSIQYIDACLKSIESLSQQITTDVHIIDNGSSDGTIEHIETHFTRFRLTKLGVNRGTTYSRNIGLKSIPSGTDYVCILDSDTIINDDAILKLSTALEVSDKYSIAVPSMQNKKGQAQVSCKKYPTLTIKLLKAMPFHFLEKIGSRMENYTFSDTTSIHEVDYGISACWLIKYSSFKSIGLLDEKIFYAPEDVDYCLCAKKLGLTTIFVSDALIIHETQRISKKKIISKTNFEHIKGLLYFFYKHRYWFRRPRF